MDKIIRRVGFVLEVELDLLLVVEERMQGKLLSILDNIQNMCTETDQVLKRNRRSFLPVDFELHH